MNWPTLPPRRTTHDNSMVAVVLFGAASVIACHVAAHYSSRRIITAAASTARQLVAAATTTTTAMLTASTNVVQNVMQPVRDVATPTSADGVDGYTLTPTEFAAAAAATRGLGGYGGSADDVPWFLQPDMIPPDQRDHTDTDPYLTAAAPRQSAAEIAAQDIAQMIEQFDTVTARENGWGAGAGMQAPGGRPDLAGELLNIAEPRLEEFG